jgi:hypothetical protein
LLTSASAGRSGRRLRDQFRQAVELLVGRQQLRAAGRMPPVPPTGLQSARTAVCRARSAGPQGARSRADALGAAGDQGDGAGCWHGGPILSAMHLSCVLVGVRVRMSPLPDARLAPAARLDPSSAPRSPATAEPSVFALHGAGPVCAGLGYYSAGASKFGERATSSPRPNRSVPRLRRQRHTGVPPDRRRWPLPRAGRRHQRLAEVAQA